MAFALSDKGFVFESNSPDAHGLDTATAQAVIDAAIADGIVMSGGASNTW